MDSEKCFILLLHLCALARRSPDRFYRKGTRWLTVYEFFVCENMLLVLPEIDSTLVEKLHGAFNQFRYDQIFNGLKAPSQEVVE